MVQSITPHELNALKSSGKTIDLIDVRTPAEFQEVHVDFAKNIPLDRVNTAAVQSLGTNKSEAPLYLICQAGTRGKQACEKLAAEGWDVVNVEGGTKAWDAAGFAVVRGKKVISLERQVRIAAGLMVLIGTILGYFIHHYWIGLAAFVGAGLTFAGITDTCGMAIILGKMPWNQVKSSCTNSKTATSASAVVK